MRSITLLSVAGILVATSLTTASDWPYWRGPEQNGISRETGIVDKWSPKGENVLWKDTGLAGRSTPIVMNGKLYTLVRNHPGTQIEGEKVSCVDAATGKLLWENAFNVFLSDVPDTRIGWSSVVGDPATGNVYALGVCGYFQCINGETGKTIWSRSLSEEYGLLTTYGGRTNFPVVFEDLVIISGVMTGWGEAAKPNHRFVAFDKLTGKAIWLNGTRPLPEDTTYSAPVIANVNGQALMIVGAGDGGLYAFQPRTGKTVWKYQLSVRGMNCTPLVDGNIVYDGQSEENPGITRMGCVAAIDASGKGVIPNEKAIWKNIEWMVGRAAPLLVDGKLYLMDDSAGLYIADAKDGKLLNKRKLGTAQRVSPLYVDGKIFTCDMNGRWATLRPKGNDVEVVQQLRLTGEVHASPIVANGRLYVQTTDCMYCIGKKDQKVASNPIPEKPKEAPIGSMTEATQIQIVPCEALIRPGEKVSFETRVYNAHGQLLEKKPAVYTCASGGTISEDGTFTAENSTAHRGVIITAKVGELKSEGRVRIVPDLPWSFDFADGKVPMPWIGATYRYVNREVNGKKLLVKITTIPKGSRSQAWFGHTDFHDYTVEADVLGKSKEGRMPDIGVITQRYTLDMMGANQQLQVRTWPPTLRAAKTISFPWKPDVWYTLKLRVENSGKQAIMRGKVWQKGTPEPKEWTIEAADDSPNTIGSPGLFGNATNAEIFVEAVRVYKN